MIISSFPAQLLKHLGVSILGATVHYSLTLIVVYLAAFRPIRASSCGALAGAAIIYSICQRGDFFVSRCKLFGIEGTDA
jgi:uncharacterized membrane protein